MSTNTQNRYAKTMIRNWDSFTVYSNSPSGKKIVFSLIMASLFVVALPLQLFCFNLDFFGRSAAQDDELFVICTGPDPFFTRLNVSDELHFEFHTFINGSRADVDSVNISINPMIPLNTTYYTLSNLTRTAEGIYLLNHTVVQKDVFSVPGYSVFIMQYKFYKGNNSYQSQSLYQMYTGDEGEPEEPEGVKVEIIEKKPVTSLGDIPLYPGKALNFVVRVTDNGTLFDPAQITASFSVNDDTGSYSSSSRTITRLSTGIYEFNYTIDPAVSVATSYSASVVVTVGSASYMASWSGRLSFFRTSVVIASYNTSSLIVKIPVFDAFLGRPIPVTINGTASFQNTSYMTEEHSFSVQPDSRGWASVTVPVGNIIPSNDDVTIEFWVNGSGKAEKFETTLN
ncbi:MAG: hypothetical protein QW728_02615, partial [Thermoplasmata archaeon]